MKKGFYFLLALIFIANTAFSQGLGIPSKRGGIGFGNLARFTGLRFNFKDRNVEKITGLNVTVWQLKNDADMTGTVNGISLGVPMAMGHETQNGMSLGLGVAATKNMSGINVGVLGAGAGQDMNGINIGGLGIGTGQDLRGFNFGGLGAGAGDDIVGINIGGLGVGAGGSVKGFSFAGLGVGSGGNVTGINLAGVGIGAGEDLSGFSFTLGGIGAGQRVRGITLAGLGIGAGEELKGITMAGIGVGSPKVTGLAIAMAVGGIDVTGIMIAPAYFRIGGGNSTDENGNVTASDPGVMKGISISAYNDIRGEQRGVAIGIVNRTRKIKGFQLGVINIVRENPKGLRVLPIFNTRFGGK